MEDWFVCSGLLFILFGGNMGNDRVVSVISWLLYFVILAVPVLNIIVMIIVLTGKNYSRSLKNFTWAFIIAALLGGGIYLAF